MPKKRWLRPLAYTLTILMAFALSAQAIASDLITGGPFDSVLAVLIAAMALGMLVVLHGLYIERHGIRARILRRVEIKKRVAQRNRLLRVRQNHALPMPVAGTAFSPRDWFAPGSVFRRPSTYP